MLQHLQSLIIAVFVVRSCTMFLTTLDNIGIDFECAYWCTKIYLITLLYWVFWWVDYFDYKHVYRAISSWYLQVLLIILVSLFKAFLATIIVTFLPALVLETLEHSRLAPSTALSMVKAFSYVLIYVIFCVNFYTIDKN